MLQKLENLKKRKHLGSPPLCVSIPVHKKQVDITSIIKRLSHATPDPEKPTPRIFHIDLDHEVG